LQLIDYPILEAHNENKICRRSRLVHQRRQVTFPRRSLSWFRSSCTPPPDLPLQFFILGGTMKVTGLQMLAGTLASGSFSDWLSRNRSFVIWLQRIAGNTIVTLGAKSLLYVGAQLLRQCLVPGCNPALPHGGTLDDPQGAALPRAPPPMPWQIVPGLAVEGGEYNLKIQAVRPVKAATVPLCVPWQGKVNLGLVLQRKRQSHCRRRNGFNRSPTTAV